MSEGKGNPKVFAIGFYKTGTSSLAAALDLLGLRTFRSGSGGPLPPESEFDAAAAEGVATNFEALHRQYPESLFVCTIRERHAWLRSEKRSATNRNQMKTDFELLNDFDRHMRRVREYFANRPENVLFIDITANPAWEPLCSFLGRPVPEIDFPHKNHHRIVASRRLRKAIYRHIRPAIPKPARPYIKKLFQVEPLIPNGWVDAKGPDL